MCRVLVIDDEPTICEFFRVVLSDHKVFAASTLHEAEEAIEKIKPAVIYLDLNLPDGNGKEFLRQHSFENPVVIFTSSLFEPEEEVELMELGATVVLEKPASAEKIRILTKRLLNLISLDGEMASISTKLSDMSKQLREARGALQEPQETHHGTTP